MSPTPPSGQPEHYVLKPTGGATQFVAERSPSGQSKPVRPGSYRELELKLEALEQRYNEVLEDAEEFATLSRQAERREAEARRHLAFALKFANRGRLEKCCRGLPVRRTDGGFGFKPTHTTDCPLVAAKNFLESKPLGSTVEGEE